jgi:protein involved in temperature-dependent protein secretion
MPRHSNNQTLKDVVEELLKNYKLDDKMRQIKLIESWGTIMGQTVANRTTEIKLYGRKLHVVLNSSSLRQELFQEREKIVKLLNEAAGAVVVEEIVFQ